MALDAPTPTDSKEDYSFWRVFTTADNLEKVAPNFYPSVTFQVVSILRKWGDQWAGNDEWQSLLNKTSLQHEVEESIVALYYLLEHAPKTKFIAVDVCGGKGLFSILLSYLSPTFLESIILLEKETAINWHHIQVANSTCQNEQRPTIEIWSGTNLHDYDIVLDRFINLPHPVALSGIHLCKQLGPAFCGLVNGLGSQKCIYACLAPCCLPRVVTCQKHKKASANTSIMVQLAETFEGRRIRLDYSQRRRDCRKTPTGGPCFLCHSPDHGMTEYANNMACPELSTKTKQEQIELKQAEHASRVPCWRCGELGHYKTDCPSNNTSSKPPAMEPPFLAVDVANVLDAPQPFQCYCTLLSSSMQERKIQVVDPGLTNQGKHQAGNWNSDRKSIFIIATL
jgi:hypothetical protein